MARKRIDSPNGDIEETAPAPTPPEEPDSGDQPNRPVAVFRYGLVRASVWLQYTELGPRHNVTCSRLYKGQDDQWHHSSSFGFRDLLALAKALNDAHTFINDEMSAASPF